MSGRIIFITLSQASVFLPVIAGYTYYKKLDTAFRLLFYFFVLSVFFEIQTNISIHLYHNNMPGLHLFTFLEMLAFSAVYLFYFKKKMPYVQPLISLNTIVYVIAAIAGVGINGIWAPNSISRTYSSVSLTCYVLIFFYDLFVSDIKLYCWQYPMFWISIGVLIYFSVNLFYFMLINYLIKNAAFTGQISLFTHAAINIIANCLFARAFTCHKNFITE